MRCGQSQMPRQNSLTLVKGGFGEGAGLRFLALIMVLPKSMATHLIRRDMTAAVDFAKRVTLPDGGPITVPFVSCRRHTRRGSTRNLRSKRSFCQIRNKAPSLATGSWRGCFKTLLWYVSALASHPMGCLLSKPSFSRHMARRLLSVMRIH